MRIHVVGAQETNAPWAFELRIIRALQAIGHNIISTDFRQDRSNLPDKLRSTHADHLLVFKGDWVPASAIETVSCRKTLWYAEYVGRVSDLDLPAFRNREVLRYNCRAFDQVLIHDPSSIAVCRRLGAREVHWLSCVMVDTVGFSRLDVPKKFDVLFIGSPTPRRKRIIAELAAHYDVHWLTVWSPEALNEVFNQARIILNIHSSAVPNIETRIGEVLASGAFLLSEELSYPDMFKDGEHLVYWRLGDTVDLAEKIAYYLCHHQEREKIAAAGYRFARENHSTGLRIQQLLRLLRGEVPDSPQTDSQFPEWNVVQRIKYATMNFRAHRWALHHRKLLGL